MLARNTIYKKATQAGTFTTTTTALRYRPGETTARRIVLRRIDTRKVQLSSSRNDSASVMKWPFSQWGINREKNGKEGKVGTRDNREKQVQTGVNTTENSSKYEKQNMNPLSAFIIDIYGFL